MVLKKGQKQGRNETTPEDYPTFAVYFLQRSSNLLAFFHFCLVSVLSSGPSLTEMKCYRNISPIIVYCVLVWLSSFLWIISSDFSLYYGDITRRIIHVMLYVYMAAHCMKRNAYSGVWLWPRHGVFWCAVECSLGHVWWSLIDWTLKGICRQVTSNAETTSN